MIDSIFVYGTLRKEGVFPIEDLLDGRVNFIGSGQIQGKIYLVDYYPGLLYSEDNAHFVRGEIYKLHEMKDLFVIDEYEGISRIASSNDLYKRITIEVHLDSGDRMVCYTYLYNRPIKKEMRWIKSGDYIHE